jgi:hypothetical protein
MPLLQSTDSTFKPERIPSSDETLLEGIPMGELKKLKVDQGDAPATPAKANVSRTLKQVDNDTLNKLETPTGKENIPCGGTQASPRRQSKRSVRIFSFRIASHCFLSLSASHITPIPKVTETSSLQSEVTQFLAWRSK